MRPIERIVNGVFGGHRPGFFEAVVYTDEMMADEALSKAPPLSEKVKIRRILQCRLIMDPIQAKSLFNWLSNHIKEYEKLFGKIVLPSELPQVSRRKEEPSYIG
jgi:hypothetical protein